jgi:hypothetical protein
VLLTNSDRPRRTARAPRATATLDIVAELAFFHIAPPGANRASDVDRACEIDSSHQHLNYGDICGREGAVAGDGARSIMPSDFSKVLPTRPAPT